MIKVIISNQGKHTRAIHVSDNGVETELDGVLQIEFYPYQEGHSSTVNLKFLGVEIINESSADSTKQ